MMVVKDVRGYLMTRWVRNTSFLIVIGASFADIGLLGDDLYRLVAFFGFLVFLATFLPVDKTVFTPPKSRVLAALVVAGLGVTAARIGGLGTYYTYFFITVALLLATDQRENTKVHEFSTYVVTLACIGILAEMVRLFPVLWHLKLAFARAMSYAAEHIAREDRNLGPTAMALPLLVSLVILALVREATARPRRVTGWIVVPPVLVGTHLAYVVFLKYYALWLARHPGGDWFLLNSQHAFIVLGATVFTIIDRPRGPRVFDGKLARILATSAASVTCGLIIALVFGWSPAPRHRPAKVLIYDAGYVNWKVPVHGVYGERSAGMFGMLPSALQSVGFHPIVSNDLRLLDGPNPPDCLVLINIQAFFDEGDKERIWRYVAAGGGLLCLGDHTGVAGIRGPFNDLLQPVGIRFEFDSSTFFGEGWNGALEYRCHPMNRGIDNAEEYQIWVGATLGLEGSARPVIVARYGYSDIGDAANIDRSYLGDRRYNPDELLGDIVLVADAGHGKGRVMVFGDTSGYQNLSLARTLDTVARSIDFLSSPGRVGFSIVAQILAISIVVFAAAATVLSAKNPIPLFAVALGLAIGSAAANVLTPVPPRFLPDFESAVGPSGGTAGIGQKRDVAVIDVSHGGAFTLRAWKNRSIGGLQLNLARDGYYPLIRDEFPYRDLATEARLLVLVAPTRGYSRKEIDAVEQFLRRGGKAIVSVGFEEIDGSRSLLRRFGFDVGDVPLARLETKAPSDSLPVVFREAWPVRYTDAAPAETLLSVWKSPLAVKRPVGKGELIVIGDSSFFHDVNLETREKYFAGNIAFLSKLAERSHTP
jgi:hypothetical protein